ncbi:MAG: hypothetical protein U0263_14900 [Polyangiaceae bacterium]
MFSRRRSVLLALLTLVFALLACKGKPESQAKLGEVVKFDDSQWEVVSATAIGNAIQGFAGDKKTSGKFVKVDFKVTNTSKQDETILDHPKVFDSQGREFKVLDDQALYIHEPEQPLTLESLPPSMMKRFTAIYELPLDAKGLSFEARALSAFGDRRKVALGI